MASTALRHDVGMLFMFTDACSNAIGQNADVSLVYNPLAPSIWGAALPAAFPLTELRSGVQQLISTKQTLPRESELAFVFQQSDHKCCAGGRELKVVLLVVLQ